MFCRSQILCVNDLDALSMVLRRKIYDFIHLQKRVLQDYCRQDKGHFPGSNHQTPPVQTECWEQERNCTRIIEKHPYNSTVLTRSMPLYPAWLLPDHRLTCRCWSWDGLSECGSGFGESLQPSGSILSAAKQEFASE